MFLNPRNAGTILVLALALLPFACGHSLAQMPVQLNANNLNAINTRIDELQNLLKDNSSIPVNPILLDREYDRIEQEIDRYSQLVAMEYPSPPFKITQVDEVSMGLKKFADAVASANCEKDNLSNFSNLFTEVNPFLYNLDRISKTYYGYALPAEIAELWDVPGLSKLPTMESEFLAACKGSKDFFQSPRRIAGIIKVLDEIKAKYQQSTVKSQAEKAAATTVLELLKQRRGALRSKISGTSPQQTLTESLPVIVGLIGAASVIAMVMVRLFPSAIQMEWVASGQVIQFVTVMILLNAIMALGLSNILHENTLGTLLGGIAGYILAQGVGRAAAREAARRANEPQEAIGPPQSPPPAPGQPSTGRSEAASEGRTR